ncbi:MAG TPA: ABC transporter substrate-binding protein [Candidatus Binatia bacterium]
MNKKITGLVVAAVLLAPGVPVGAQQPGKIPRVGLLNSNVAEAFRTRTESFRQGLRELGYIEGRNILIDYRYADGKVDRLAALAAELVSLKVDVIVTAASSATRAAKAATSTIPIVMAQDNDPVGTGAVAGLAHPGANVTGLSSLSVEIGGKQMELLKEILPRLARVVVIGTSTGAPAHAQRTKEIELVAEALKVQFQYIDVPEAKDIETAFKTATKGRAGAMIVLGGLVLTAYRTDVANFAAKNRLPAIFNVPEFVEVGGLMTYGASYNDLYRRAATYVDKILRGAKPANLPVEQPTKFELIINLKAAKQIGLTIPPNVLARADRVIK